MTLELAVDIMRNLLQTALLLAIPILGTAMVVGLLISFVQSRNWKFMKGNTKISGAQLRRLEVKRFVML